MGTKKKSRRYFGRQSGRMEGTHGKPFKEEKHKEKPSRKRKKIRRYKHLTEQ